MKTIMANPKKVEACWHIVDAEGKTLGRLASQIAARLRGKCTAWFTPHTLTGEHVVVINAEKFVMTGNKIKTKTYSHYTGYPGGLKVQKLENLLAKFPTRILEKAIKGMLPKNPLGREAFRRLKVYAGSEHPHAAQQPKSLTIHE